MAFFVESTASLYSVMILQSGMTISISVLEAFTRAPKSQC